MPRINYQDPEFTLKSGQMLPEEYKNCDIDTETPQTGSFAMMEPKTPYTFKKRYVSTGKLFKE